MKKTVTGRLLFLVFLDMVVGDLHTLLAVLLLPPECLGEVRCHVIFQTSPPAPSKRPPGWEQGCLDCSSLPANTPTVSKFSKMVKSHGNHCHNCLVHSQLLLVHFLKHFGHPPCWLLWKLQILLKSVMDHFSLNAMGLSKFHDTLLPVILHFSGDMSDGSLCIEVSLSCRHQFLYFTFLYQLMSAFLSRPCHATFITDIDALWRLRIGNWPFRVNKIKNKTRWTVFTYNWKIILFLNTQYGRFQKCFPYRVCNKNTIF